MNPSNNSEKFAIRQIISHPNYTANDTVFDIALVELNSTVEFTKYILPMCLPESSVKFPDNTSCWVTGWGRTKSKGETYKRNVLPSLLFVNLPGVNWWFLDVLRRNSDKIFYLYKLEFD
uniref:Peptidase S1 domain-containing protein n=1 Tax=Naja naja TaxID=35670 RepID=A0A8C6X4C0_NAJNA